MANKITHINTSGLDIELIEKTGIKNIYLRVKPPEGIISVSAPSGFSLELISEFISHNINIIHQAREKIFSQQESSSNSKQECISGTKFYLWGKPYILDVKESSRKTYSVKFAGESIILTVPENSSHEGCERVLNELYRSEIKRVLPEIIKIYSVRVGVQIKHLIFDLHGGEHRRVERKDRFGAREVISRLCAGGPIRFWPSALFSTADR